jgi:hypothetical protein
MPELRKVAKIRGSMWLLAMLIFLLAHAAYAACYENIRIVYQDGTEQVCSVFCTFPGGWLCKPMSGG